MHPTPTLERLLKSIELELYQKQLCRTLAVDTLYGFSRGGSYYVPRPLYNLGPPAGGARYTVRGGPPSLYLAEDYETSLREYTQIGEPARLTPERDARAVVTYTATISLDKVLDLTKPAIQCALDTTLAELKEPWRYRKDGRVPPTHRLGRAVVKAGHIQAIRFPSSKKGEGVCAVILTDTLKPPSFVRIEDPESRLVAEIPSP